MNSKPLCMAIIDAFLMLESSEADQLDPDLAVRTMENMSSSLLALSEAEQMDLRRTFLEIASGSEPRDESFIRSLPDLIGLASADDEEQGSS